MIVVMVLFQLLLNLRKIFHFRHNSFRRQLLQVSASSVGIVSCEAKSYESYTKLTIYLNINSALSVRFR